MNHRFEVLRLGSILSGPVLKANFYFPLSYCMFQIALGEYPKGLLSALDV